MKGWTKIKQVSALHSALLLAMATSAVLGAPRASWALGVRPTQGSATDSAQDATPPKKAQQQAGIAAQNGEAAEVAEVEGVEDSSKGKKSSPADPKEDSWFESLTGIFGGR